MGYWLAWDVGSEQPQCIPNPCIQEKKDTPIFFNGRCTRLHTPEAECPSGHVVGFAEDEFFPSCVLAEANYAAAALLGGSRKCPKGTHRSFNGVCSKYFQW